MDHVSYIHPEAVPVAHARIQEFPIGMVLRVAISLNRALRHCFAPVVDHLLFAAKLVLVVIVGHDPHLQ